MSTHTPVAPSAIEISNVAIRQDCDGRYCINDLHKAAGNLPKHRPAYWLVSQQAKELIIEIETAGIPAVKKSEGRNGGTYVVKELVYAYAMWISPKFHLAVIRAYDTVQTRQPQPLPTDNYQAHYERLSAQLEKCLVVNLNQADGLKQITFQFETHGAQTGRWLVDLVNGKIQIQSLDTEQHVLSQEQLAQNIAILFPNQRLVNKHEWQLLDALRKLLVKHPLQHGGQA